MPEPWDALAGGPPADGYLISSLERFPSAVDHYPYDFLEQVLWAMNQATQGVLEIVTWFAQGKAAAAPGWSAGTS